MDRGYPKPEKVINEEYKKYVLSHPCLVCGNPQVDPDHLLARGRGSANQNDYSLIPLCRKCHSERHTGGNEKLETKYRISLWFEAWRLLARWIESGHARF